MKASKLIILVATALLSGCSTLLQVKAMSKDTGKVYVGRVIGDGFSSASMDITIEGVNYTGLFTIAQSNDSVNIGSSFDSVHTYSANSYINSYGTGTYASSTIAGTKLLKGIFSSPEGRGLRCESTATGRGGAGICIDDKGRVYDIVVSK